MDNIWILYVLCVVLGITALVFGLRLLFLRRAVREIAEAFAYRVKTDTNTLIDVPMNDKTVRELVLTINKELRLLRSERRRYQQGGTELRDTITGISHDLRTPLTAICGYLELLEREQMSEEQRRHLDMIVNRVNALRELTEELFRYSVVILERDALELVPVKLSDALEESLAAHYPQLLERGIEPQIDLPETPVVRRLDRKALARIFGNILTNAIKYSDGDLSVALTEDGEVTFQNAASGLDQVSVGRLFDRFFTVESGRDSTGLGLAIAKALAERLGGEIAASYDCGRLTIRLRFPKE